MKRNCVVGFVAIILLTQLKLTGQGLPESQKDYLDIGYTKTTSVIFPYPVVSVDRGTQDILAQKASGVENILQLKAAITGFAETNLTVVTADGRVYPYIVRYADNPSQVIIFEKSQNAVEKLAVFTPEATNDQVHNNTRIVFSKLPYIRNQKTIKSDIGISLTGLYCDEDVLYFQLEMSNRSRLNYQINALRFFIRDRKKSKRTASQEIDITPVHVQGDIQSINNKSIHTVVVAVPLFTIPDKKEFLIQMQEKNGGRNLLLSIQNKAITNARLIF